MVELGMQRLQISGGGSTSARFGISPAVQTSEGAEKRSAQGSGAGALRLGLGYASVAVLPLDGPIEVVETLCPRGGRDIRERCCSTSVSRRTWSRQRFGTSGM